MIVAQDTVKSPGEILSVCQRANSDENCIGLILWMHTFSPAKMWISGLKVLSKPYMHLHTQFNAELPFADINMHFMNLNQSAHGDREFGHISTRLRHDRKVVVGHWANESVQRQIDSWCRVAMGWNESRNLKIARFGDNMRDVAVTEGDKVAAQIQFGYEVNGYSLEDLTQYVDAVTDSQINTLIEEYEASYTLTDRVKEGGSQRSFLEDSARIEIGLRAFLKEGGFKGFTTNFQDLTGLKQLPGLAAQRLMKDGYGYGAEGDWRTAALLRAMKVMSAGLSGGTSFMEDYVYHLDPAGSRILGAHMLEVCESIAKGKPVLDVQPLSIGGKDNPARLIFTAPAGPAICASLIDLGNRFRMVVNEVEVVDPPADLPKLPVARVLWDPKPNLKVAAEAWILAGGAHHSVFTQALTSKYVEDYCEIAGIEYVLINEETEIRKFKQDLRLGEIYYHLARGI